jgi:hypothetical protein
MRTTTTRRGAAVLLLALSLPVGLTACGGATERAQTGSTAAQQDAGGEQDGGEQDGGADPSGGASTGAMGKVEAVLATAEGEFERTPLEEEVRVPVRLDVTALERIEGDAVELRFRLTNLSDVTWEPWGSLGDSGFGGFGASDVVLLDLPGDRRYLSLLDSEDNCVCTAYAGADFKIPAGESHDFYVRFVAPPEDVASVEVEVPGFAPVAGVEISS